MSLTFTLVDVSGVSHTLALDSSLHGIAVATGAKGLGIPPLTINSNKLPYAPGSALSRIATPPSTVDIPLFVQQSTAALLEQALDDLSGWLLPGTERKSTPDTIRFQVTSTDGTSREIEGVFTGSLDDDDAITVAGDIWQDLELSILCPDPYPRDVTPVTHTFTSGTGVRSWWPYYPLDVTPSNVYAEESITNDGHLECWPVWTITGPATNVILSNLTTDEVLDLSAYSVPGGDVVTIDTSERGVTAKTIQNTAGANLWPYASATSVLWPLERGSNTVRVQAAGTTVASSIVMAYRRRWGRFRRR